MKKICPQCGKECRNLSVHLRFCGKSKPDTMSEHLVVDEVTPDKPLSALLSELTEILKKYRSSTSVKVTSQGGRNVEVEIITRIQL